MYRPNIQEQGRVSHLLLIMGVALACAFFLTFSTQTARAGGVKRRLTVITDPPGAKVYIDGYEIGITPISTYFTYYGTRKVRIVREGYETLIVDEMLPAPWYEYPGIDFFCENFSRSEIDNRITLSYTLEPRQVVIQDHLIQRAELFRLESLAQAGVTPPPAPADSAPQAPTVPEYRPVAPGFNPAPRSNAPASGTLPPGVSTGATQPRYTTPQRTASDWSPNWNSPGGTTPPPRVPGISPGVPRVVGTPTPPPSGYAPQSSPGVIPAAAEVPAYSPMTTPTYDAPFLR